MRAKLRLTFWLAALFVVTSPVRSQCPQWKPGFHIPGVHGAIYSKVLCSALFDDGHGPALYIGGEFDTVDAAAARHIAKWSGSSWAPLSSGMDGDVYAMAVFDDGTGAALYAGGNFRTAGGVSANLIAKWNGSTWTPLSTGLTVFPSTSVTALAVFDDGTGPALYVAGYYWFVGTPPAHYIARWDGTSWTPIGDAGTNSLVHALIVYDDGGGAALYAGGSLITAGGGNQGAIAKWNGLSWAPLGSRMAGTVNALAVYDDGGGAALYAGGWYWTIGGLSTNHIAKWNGSSWAPLGSGMNLYVDALGVYDDGSGPALFAGGEFSFAGGVPASKIAKWNGSSWSAVGSGIGSFTSGIVLTLAAFDDGSGSALYAGGAFVNAGSLSVDNFARWKASAWSVVGGGSGLGLHGGAGALTVFDDGSGPALFVGGSFDLAGTVSANNIARWNSSGWAPLSSGTDGSVTTLAVFDDGSGSALYAGGSFSNAGGSSASNIARWNGSAWSPLAGGTTGTVYALTVFDDGSGSALYAGGQFDTAGGVSASKIARWNGASWTPLGSGLSATVYALTVFDDGGGTALYAGGTFTIAGGSSANGIAKWNGSSWMPLSTGVSVASGTSFVGCFVVHDDGSGRALIAGGGFSSAGGVAADGIAKWNGSSWAPLGSGLGTNLYIASLAVHDDGNGAALYAGNVGYYSSVPGNIVAKWNGSSWSTLGGNFNGGVGELASFDDHTGGRADLYAGGGFFRAGEVASSGIAEWLGCGPPGVPFCFGDGSGVACPCANNGASRHGCANSVQPSGASLTAIGIPSVNADTIVLRGSRMPNATALYLQSTSQDNGGLGTPLFDGIRCVSGTILRLGVEVNAAGASQYPAFGNSAVSVRGQLPPSGGTRSYQVYYRNPAPAFCPPATANWSNGLAIAWYP